MSFYSLKMLEDKVSCLFNDKPTKIASNKYKLVKTADIVEEFNKFGWYPWILDEELKDLKAVTPTSEHILRLRTENEYGTIRDRHSDVYMEVLIANSCNTKKALQIRIGLFRQVCSNGMVTGEDLHKPFVMKHVGNIHSDLRQYIQNIPSQIKSLDGVIKQMEHKVLTQSDIYDMARVALLIRYQHKKLPSHDQVQDVINIQRIEDNSFDLWHVFNRIQENVLNGNYYNQYLDEEGEMKSMKARAITSKSYGIELNKNLFSLATRYLRGS